MGWRLHLPLLLAFPSLSLPSPPYSFGQLRVSSPLTLYLELDLEKKNKKPSLAILM